MKLHKKSWLLANMILLLSTFFVWNAAHADWASRFVVNDGMSYTVSDQTVEIEHIGERIGKVTSYSDEEGTYSGNFSNVYPKGTEYYAIKGVEAHVAIAVKAADDSFIKANYEGKYAGTIFDWKKASLYAFGCFFLVMIVLLIRNNLKKP
ncbi:hypothetical protein [Candidatus Pristimantibacillus sp. PTI5]|uniref:hypothetical protein n=1 Tax=Candidatus Pristimantibacillus sp. PTI5 TaxID=3400422 RepID=UPI003B02746B